jgi:predicted nuclease of predicted toxin-antitoxin system
MKLLFDENLSPKLPRLLAGLFSGSVHSVHVRECGLKGLPDEDVWEFARANGFVIISKDSDFHQRSLLYGNPPKIIWLRIGNCTRNQVVQLITSREQDIIAFDVDPFEAVLVLS